MQKIWGRTGLYRKARGSRWLKLARAARATGKPLAIKCSSRFAVNKNLPDSGTSRRVAPAVADKLTRLLTSFSYLRSSNRALIKSLHGSIEEMRELSRKR